MYLRNATDLTGIACSIRLPHYQSYPSTLIRPPYTSYAMAYVEDTFPVYRLDQADLEKYLSELHGSRDFHIEVGNLGCRIGVC